MAEPQVGFWHPDRADDEDFDPKASAAYTSMLAPFMATYPGLTVDDYWCLTLSEHGAMLEWLYDTEVLERPKPKKVVRADVEDAIRKLERFRDGLDDEGKGGVREPRPPVPVAPSGSAAVDVPA